MRLKTYMNPVNLEYWADGSEMLAPGILEYGETDSTKIEEVDRTNF
jgi:hypothetical protein